MYLGKKLVKISFQVCQRKKKIYDFKALAFVQRMWKVLLVTSACPEVAPLTALQKFCGWSNDSDAKFIHLGFIK